MENKSHIIIEVHHTRSEKETYLLAKSLSENFRGNEVVFLIGELGAGKTVFAKGLAFGLGLKNTHQVCSPSYTLVNIYKAKFPIFHIDLYRLEKESEILDLGWEDFLEKGVIIIEWAEKLKSDINAIKVNIEISGNEQRKIRINQ